MRLIKEKAQDLKAEYLNLLDEGRAEQFYQEYLEKNTALIPREFVQNHGVHFHLVLRKLSFGADYTSDFFYFSKSSCDWNAVLIEIEKPSSRFFRGNTNDFHSDFLKALQQISQWRAWLDQPVNRAAFLTNDAGILHSPPHMAINPTDFKFVLVIGRRSEWENNAQRRLLVRSQERDDFKIVTYDSLAEELEHKYLLYIASRHNQFLDILTDEIVDIGIFSWLDPNQLRVSEAFHQAMKAHGPTNQWTFKGHQPVDALKAAVDKIRVRS